MHSLWTGTLSVVEFVVLRVEENGRCILHENHGQLMNRSVTLILEWKFLLVYSLFIFSWTLHSFKSVKGVPGLCWSSFDSLCILMMSKTFWIPLFTLRHTETFWIFQWSTVIQGFWNIVNSFDWMNTCRWFFFFQVHHVHGLRACLPSILTCSWLQAVLNLQVPVEHSKEVGDCKNLIKTLVMGNWSFQIIIHIVY